MRRGVFALVVGMCVVLVVPGAAPGAQGKAKPCKKGTVRAKVGGHATCLSKKIALPTPTTTAPALVQVRAAMQWTQLGFKTRSGRRAKSLSQRVGRSSRTARSRLLRATSRALAKARKARAQPTVVAAADEACEALDLAGGSFKNGDYSADGVKVSLDATRSGMQMRLQTTVRGDTYTVRYTSGESECDKYALAQCPNADGSLDSTGRKGKVDFSMTVTRSGKVLSKRAFAQNITAETRGRVADDARLDHVDVRYTDVTTTVSDGLRYTTTATRLTRIDMRTGKYAPGESVSIGTVSKDGESVNIPGSEASAQEFAAFVGQTMSNYRSREKAWQSPNTCAKLTFNAASNTLTVRGGAQDRFGAAVAAKAGGDRASKARWTLSGPQNGTFSPTSTKDLEPSFSYTVATHPSGRTLSVVARATSTAGVAQDTWSQKIEDALTTITGTFTGHATQDGVVYDWTGTATFQRVNVSGIDANGIAGIFQLVSGQATVTISGSLEGSGCQGITGTSTIPLQVNSVWTVTGTDKPYSYQMQAVFDPAPPNAQLVDCDPPGNAGPAGLGSMPVAALVSGDIGTAADPAALIKTTDDPYTYVGSASATTPGVPASWSWSFTGSS